MCIVFKFHIIAVLRASINYRSFTFKPLWSLYHSEMWQMHNIYDCIAGLLWEKACSAKFLNYKMFTFSYVQMVELINALHTI